MAVEKKSSAKNFTKMVVVGVERRLKRERLEEEREREGLLLMSSHQRLCWVIFPTKNGHCIKTDPALNIIDRSHLRVDGWEEENRKVERGIL